MKVAWVFSPFVVALAACTTPAQYGGTIHIDQEGLAARLSRACGLGKAAAAGGTCESLETDASEMDGSDDEELEETDASQDTEPESTDAGSTDRG